MTIFFDGNIVKWKDLENFAGAGKREDLGLSDPSAIFGFRNTYAAAPVVANPSFYFEETGKITTDAIDWDATKNRLEEIHKHGMGTAFPMDTAQRGSEITGWKLVEPLITLNIDVAKSFGNPERAMCGAGVELAGDLESCSLDDVIGSYVQQAKFIQDLGGTVILFPNTVFPRRFPEQKHYKQFIDGVLRRVQQPVYLHWLGKQFNPEMENYWGFGNIWDAARNTVVPLMESHKSKIKGIKLSTLDEKFEKWLRVEIAKTGQFVLTGDDLNFRDLIRGQEGYFSHALLGILGGTYRVAAKALEYLKNGDEKSYERLMAPLEKLSRKIFEDPTWYYKIGLTFFAYLNGDQKHFQMVGGIQGHRSIPHLVELFNLAEQAQVLKDPSEALSRFKPILNLGGYDLGQLPKKQWY